VPEPAPDQDPTTRPAVHATPAAPPTAVATAAFAVPAEAVWRYRLDFANLPEYNPDVSDVERVADGDPAGVGGVHGVGARYRFGLADPRRPAQPQPVELWMVAAEEPTLVAAGMLGGNEAYEEFVVRPLDAAATGAAGTVGCEATLTLWVTLPDGLPDDVIAAAADGSLEQISKELRLMKEVLEGRGGPGAGAGTGGGAPETPLPPAGP